MKLLPGFHIMLNKFQFSIKNKKIMFQIFHTSFPNSNFSLKQNVLDSQVQYTDHSSWHSNPFKNIHFLLSERDSLHFEATRFIARVFWPAGAVEYWNVFWQLLECHFAVWMRPADGKWGYHANWCSELNQEDKDGKEVFKLITCWIENKKTLTLARMAKMFCKKTLDFFWSVFFLHF